MESTDNRPQNFVNTYSEDQIEDMAANQGYCFGIFNVAKPELKRFLWMFFSFTLIGFIYSIAREFKDALVISRQDAISINFLKLFAIPPAAIFCTFFVSRSLQNNTNLEVLYKFVGVFVGYFFVYGLIILPLRDYIEPSMYFDVDITTNERFTYCGINAFIGLLLSIIRWTGSLHFVVAEMWGTMILSLLFMSFCNDVLPFKQFLRFMPLFYVGSNIGLFFSGLGCNQFNNLCSSNGYLFNQRAMMGVFVLMGISSIFTFICLKKSGQALDEPLFTETKEKKKKKKVKSTVSETLKLMMKSRLVLCICFTVLGYGILTNITESAYKKSISVYARSEGHNISLTTLKYQSRVQMGVAVIVITLLLTPFKRFINIAGWRFVALMTPLWCMIGSLIVFTFAMFNTYHDNPNQLRIYGWKIFKVLFGDANRESMRLLGEVETGVMVCIGIKALKYAAFDLAKEAISMKINSEYRARFKGAYDGVCGKLGKATGSLYSIVASLLYNSEDYRVTSSFGIAVSATIGIIWVTSVFYLAKKYNECDANNTDIDIDVIGKKGQDL